jgi:beta-galactosidase
MYTRRNTLSLNVIFFLFTLSVAAFASLPDTVRIKTSLDDKWRFTLGDPQGAGALNFNDLSWQKVILPHTWNAVDAFDEEPGYTRGPAWYRRDLKIGHVFDGKRLFLYFEGANQVADVFVNGKKAGSHVGGYTAFCFDITDLIQPGARNVLAVRVDNSFNEDIPPLTADFDFYGGIYRDVWLIASSDLHFNVTDHASPGVQITTPDITNGKGAVSIEGTIVNDSSRTRSFEVISAVYDAAGRRVASVTSKIKAKPKSEANFSSAIPPVTNIQLWSPDFPYLYTVRSSILENGKVVDNISQPLGFRWYSFDPDKGFSLNGNSLKLRGTNRHQDYKGLGNAVPDSLHIHDMELIKDAGFNFVRLAHYPQDPSVLETADRLGILIWEEIPVVNYITKSQRFTDNSLNMLRDMIRQHRNHPSIVLWGYMNEIFLRVPKGRDDLYPATVELARKLNDAAHLEDPNRPTTMACHGNDIYNPTGLAAVPDVIGWNLYSGWYGGKLEDFEKFLDDQHSRFPQRPMIVSEYGANSDRRLHSTEPRRFDSTAEYQREFHESYLAQIAARPYLSGTALWSTFDFGSEFRGETIPHVNQKGLFTFDRKPKDVLYLYKAAFSNSDVLHIAASDWKYRAGPTNKTYRIDVYTNLATVELYLNGQSLGKKTVDFSRKAAWDVLMRDGLNRLTAHGQNGGKMLTASAEINYRVINVSSPEIAINVGSNADFVDEENRVWMADQPYRPGTWGFIGQRSKWVLSDPADRDILGTDNDPLYQTMQEGLSAYKFDVPDGNYEVELLFAETKRELPGQRVFSVKINGEIVLDKLDLAATAKPRHAFAKTFAVKAHNGLTIEFVPVMSEPILSGIRVIRK